MEIDRIIRIRYVYWPRVAVRKSEEAAFTMRPFNTGVFPNIEEYWRVNVIRVTGHRRIPNVH